MTGPETEANPSHLSYGELLKEVQNLRAKKSDSMPFSSKPTHLVVARVGIPRSHSGHHTHYTRSIVTELVSTIMKNGYVETIEGVDRSTGDLYIEGRLVIVSHTQ